MYLNGVCDRMICSSRTLTPNFFVNSLLLVSSVIPPPLVTKTNGILLSTSNFMAFTARGSGVPPLSNTPSISSTTPLCVWETTFVDFFRERRAEILGQGRTKERNNTDMIFVDARKQLGLFINASLLKSPPPFFFFSPQSSKWILNAPKSAFFYTTAKSGFRTPPGAIFRTPRGRLKSTTWVRFFAPRGGGV